MGLPVGFWENHGLKYSPLRAKKKKRKRLVGKQAGGRSSDGHGRPIQVLHECLAVHADGLGAQLHGRDLAWWMSL